MNYAKSIRTQGGFSQSKIGDLFTQYGSGSAIYHSEEFKYFREIHKFYEELGLQVSLGALDFDLVFAVITFPTDFAVETAALCAVIGENWFEKKHGIAGMCENSEKLQKLYEDRRAAWRNAQSSTALSTPTRYTPSAGM